MLIFVLLTVHWALAPGVVEGGCRGLRHVENGRTFFRYGGLFVTFSCNPGFRIHGHRTSSCVSGQWVREPPLCVAPGCTSLARLMHGSTVLSPDGSLVRFACDGGFRLFGSSLLYCRGDRWNGSAPVCKESDIMSSFHLKQMSSYEPTPDLIPDILPNQRSLFNTISNTDAKLTLLKPSLLGVSQPKASLRGDLAKSPQKIPEKRPAKKAWFDKATTQGREEISGLRGTVNKLDTLKEPARNVNPLAVPWLTPVSSPTALMRISPVSSPPKPTVSILLVTAVTNEQKTQTSSSLLDRMLSLPPGDGERPPPLMLTAHRAQTESVLPVLRTSATTVLNVVLTTAYLHSDGFTTSTPRKDSQEVLKETALSDIKNPLKPPKMPHSPTVSSPELPLSRQDSFFPVASPKPFTVSSPPFITNVLQEEAPPQRSPTAGVEDLLPRTEVLTAATRPGPALRLTEPPDVITTDPYLPYPVTEPEREQTAAGEDSAVPLHMHRFPVSSTDRELNDISGSDRIWPESVPPHIQRNRTLVTSTQSQENVERPGTAGKQEPESSTWPGLPFTDSETPGFPVRTRRPVCPYPPLPAHGTFYFHTIINPGPFQYKHYIQYACYPGYTLAHGDVHSYCLRDGRWSGSTPKCIEVTPCALNNGGCSQVCRASPENHAECLCLPGFLLLQDQRTCRDLDECVEGLHQCQQVCENTLGSYRCSCSDGFQLSADRTSCSDVDECVVAVGRTGCTFGCVNTPGSFLCRCPPGHSLNLDGSCEDNDECMENGGQGSCEGACVNTPGSFHCACPYGYQLAGDGRTCISECPPGHRKQRSDAPAGNSTTGLCVDINECQEMEMDHPEKCEWKCVNLPGSHLCICPRGYTPHPGGHRCTDFNECALRNGGCSHTCVNQRGGYRCACPKNYRLSPYNRRTCQPAHSSQRTVS